MFCRFKIKATELVEMFCIFSPIRPLEFLWYSFRNDSESLKDFQFKLLQVGACRTALLPNHPACAGGSEERCKVRTESRRFNGNKNFLRSRVEARPGRRT